MEIIKIIVLVLSGLLLMMVGLMRMTNPVKTYAKNSGIALGNEVDLLNEIRGASALMFCGGIIILLGTIISVLTTSSFVVATLIFLGFAVGRLLSVVVDGKPNKQLVTGLITEIVLGAANVFCLINTI